MTGASDIWIPTARAVRGIQGVKVPSGPFDATFCGLGTVSSVTIRHRCPVPSPWIRGEWDGLLPDEDARWLFDAFQAAPIKRDIKIGRGTHLMHLEVMRAELYSETNAFLSAKL